MREKIVIAIVIVIAVLGTVVFWRGRFGGEKPVSEAEEVKVPAINGVLVPEAVAKRRPIAVVIENHTDARPQSGLTDADIVYETLAEGGITRFLALYQIREPKEIGPIRSARPYFNFLANEWAAAYAHVGGSTQALSELNSNVYKKLDDINQFFYGDYFYRSKERLAPHNAYTTIELLRDLMKEKKWQDWQPRQLGQHEVVPTDQQQTAITKIAAQFYVANYTANFTYDPTTSSYARSNGAKPLIDKNNNLTISPQNVLVQFVDDYVVPLETVNGIGLKLEDGGRAVLFTGGTLQDGTWSYTSGTTNYLTAQGQPMKFQPGQTWIILMPKSLEKNVSWN
jgi:hypothetical protein